LDLDSDSDSDETSVVTFACCFVMARYNLLFVVVLDALQMHISKADNRGHSTRSDRMALRIERIVIIFFKNVLRSTHSLTKTKKIDIRKLRADAVAAAFDAEAEAAGIHLDQSAATASSSSSPSDQHADGYFDWSVAIDASRDVFEKGKEATVYLRTCSSERERERERDLATESSPCEYCAVVLVFVLLSQMFVVETKTDSSSVLVLQRFSDFTDLHHKLKSRYPKANLPRLPGRHILRSHNDDFKERRRRELNYYIQQLAVCSVCVTSLCLCMPVCVCLPVCLTRRCWMNVACCSHFTRVARIPARQSCREDCRRRRTRA
jgi:hypothetical protein